MIFDIPQFLPGELLIYPGFLVTLILFAVSMAAAITFSAIMDNQIKHSGIQEIESNIARRGAYVA